MNDPSFLTDRQLFDALSTGDADALAELARRHSRGLYDFALRGTLDEYQAASVVDEAFRRIREPGVQVPPQIDFRTWLYSLCLVEVLALANETRTARVSTDSPRFYRRTTDIAAEIAHWVWQAARGLRTRDYCVLDLTLRRGLTPEELAEAASLTRSNLYASIGRARGAFEETFAAVLLFEYGRDACPELNEMVADSPGDSLRPALRHQIIEHADDCEACRRTLGSLPAAAEVYISLADVDLPEPLGQRILGDTDVPLPTGAQDPPPASSAAAAAFAAGAAALEPDVPAPDTPGLWDEPVEPTPAAAEPPPARVDETPYEQEDAVPEEPLPEPVASASFAGDDEGLSEPDDEFEPEDVPEPVSEPEAVPATPLLVSRRVEPAPAAPVRLQEPEPEYEYEERRPVRGRAASLTREQPLMWTYALLGVAAVIAIYLGVAVADSLQSGGADSGAVPLDTAPGVSAEREIACGELPIEMNDGESTLISFDEDELDGYQITNLSYAPVSDFAEFADLEATLEDPYSIRFVARNQDTAEARQEEFELRIRWERGEESASSVCRLLVNVNP